MKKSYDPSLSNYDRGEIISVERRIKHNYYLKNIIEDLINEEESDVPIRDSGVLSVMLTVSNVTVEVIIDTGAELTLINERMFEEILMLNNGTLPVLPVKDLSFVGATGRKNQTIKKQVLLDISKDNVIIPITFLIAKIIPFNYINRL